MPAWAALSEGRGAPGATRRPLNPDPVRGHEKRHHTAGTLFPSVVSWLGPAARAAETQPFPVPHRACFFPPTHCSRPTLAQSLARSGPLPPERPSQ